MDKGKKPEKGNRSSKLNTLIFVVIGIFLVFSLGPMLWMVLTGFKHRGEFFTYPPVFIPKHFDWSNFLGGIELGGAKAIFDVLIIAGSSALISLIVGSLAAYSLSRFKIGGKNLAFWILSIRMLPPIAAALPLFILYSSLHLLDTYGALIITYSLMNIPFAVWMLKGFFDELPPSLEESALVDGCGRLAAFYKIALPLIAPGLVATTLFNFIFSWNEFLFALVFTRSHVTPLTVFIAGLIGGHEILWGEIAAVGTMASLPIIVLAIFLQRYLVRGLTMGAVKG